MVFEQKYTNINFTEERKKYKSNRKMAVALGMDEATVRRNLAKEKRKQELTEQLDDKLPHGQKLRGVSTLYDSDGNATMQWVKTNADLERQQEMLFEAAKALADDMPKPAKVTPPKDYNENMACVLPLADHHHGLYSWAAETGDDFNLEISEQLLCGAFEYYIETMPSMDLCVIANMGDFFHASNYEGATKKSNHALDMAGRFPEIMGSGIRMLRYVIEKAASKHKRIEFVNCVGNHGEEIEDVFGLFLNNIYQDHDNISVHSANGKRRHYVEHGVNGLGFTHGHQTKDNDLPIIFATEQPDLWGRTSDRWFYRGHHHHNNNKSTVVRNQDLTELRGCVVKQVRSLAAKDSYTVQHGYFAGRSMQCDYFHAKYGWYDTRNLPIDMLIDYNNDRLEI